MTDFNSFDDFFIEEPAQRPEPKKTGLTEAPAERELRAQREPEPVPEHSEKEEPREEEPRRSRRASRASRKTRRMREITRAVYFCAVFLTFSIVTLILVFGKRPTVSHTENRTLTKFPKFSVSSFFSGKYTSQIAKWYNDTAPNRDQIKTIAAEITDMRGVSFGDVVIYSGDGPQKKEADEASRQAQEKNSSVPEASSQESSVQPAQEETSVSESSSESSVESSESSEEESEESLDNSNPEAEGELTNGGGILISGTRAMEIFGGLYDKAAEYAQTLEQYYDRFGGNMNVYEMTVPVSIAYYCPSNYLQYTQDQEAMLDYIGEHTKNVHHVKIFNQLLKHKDEDIYYRTDHHWSLLGAYYAAEAFAKEAGVDFKDLSTYTTQTYDGFVGSMYSFTQDPVLLNNPDQFITYEPDVNYDVKYYDMSFERGDYTWTDLLFSSPDTGYYASIIGGDQHITKITSDVKNGRKLCIFKDSYGNALVPFLVGSFEEIYVVDVRYFEGDAVSFVQEQGITDTLFAMCIFKVTSYDPAFVLMN